jgi:fluoride exporter
VPMFREWLTRIDARQVVAIFVGGALGALARVGLDLEFPAAAGTWPWATFAINITGSFLLAYFATRLQDRLPQSTYRRPLLGTGLCGTYTTFSTMQVEILKMFDHDRPGLALGYAAASVIAGFLAVALATGLVRRVRVLR